MYVCDPCKTEGRSREATSFCENCNEYFCNSCSLQHKKFKVSKDHKQQHVSEKKQTTQSSKKQASSSGDFSKLPKGSKDDKQRKVPETNQTPLSSKKPASSSGEISKLSISDHTVPCDDGLLPEPANIETAPSDNAVDESHVGAMATAPTDTKNRDILQLKIKSSRKVNIKLPGDTEAPRISGCDFLPNGDILLIDSENASLKSIDKAGKVKCIANFLGMMKFRPWSLIVVDERNVAITFPNVDRALQFFQISPSFSKGSTIAFTKRCYGVATAVGRIHVTCHDNVGKEQKFDPGEVHTLDKSGNEIWKIGGMHAGENRFRSPEYITVKKDGSAIYVSDSWARSISALSADGKILFKIKADGLKGMAGIQIDPLSNLFICGFHSEMVQVVNVAEKSRKNRINLITCTDGLKKPESIAYRHSDRTLVVGSFQQNDVYIFQLE